MALPLAILSPYPESLFNDDIRAAAFSEVEPFPTVIYAGGGLGKEGLSIRSSSPACLDEPSPAEEPLPLG